MTSSSRPKSCRLKSRIFVAILALFVVLWVGYFWLRRSQQQLTRSRKGYSLPLDEDTERNGESGPKSAIMRPAFSGHHFTSNSSNSTAEILAAWRTRRLRDFPIREGAVFLSPDIFAEQLIRHIDLLGDRLLCPLSLVIHGVVRDDKDSWSICPQRIQDPCRVVSIGDGKGDAGIVFEDELMDRFNCSVHLFDAGMRSLDSRHLSGRLKVTRVNADTRGGLTPALDALHDQRRIDVLKVDLARGEWRLLEDAQHSHVLRQQVSQLALTIHLNPTGKSTTINDENDDTTCLMSDRECQLRLLSFYWFWLDVLDEEGFAAFSVHPVKSAPLFRIDNQRNSEGSSYSCCFKLVFLNRWRSM